MIQRVGQDIRLKTEAIAAYERLHMAVWPDVLAVLRAHHICNYSIFWQGTLLFAYYEYLGTDWGKDTATLGSDPAMQRWLALIEPLQDPLPERAPDEWWATMPLIFHTD